MKNFIFKSTRDFHKILFNKLEIIQSELRHQRQDHVTLQRDIESLRMDLNLRKQADSYYEEHRTGEAHLGLEDSVKDIPDIEDL